MTDRMLVVVVASFIAVKHASRSKIKTWDPNLDDQLEAFVLSAVQQGIQEYVRLGGTPKGRAQSVAWDNTRGSYGTWRDHFCGGDRSLQDILETAILNGIEEYQKMTGGFENVESI